MPWPTVPVVTTGMDADTDNLPRADILDHTNKFNQLIAMRGVAGGVCDLDASALIPSARLPAVYQPLDDQLTTLAGITAQQATDLASISTFMGTVLNDENAATARGTLGVNDIGFGAVGTIALVGDSNNLGTTLAEGATVAGTTIRGVYYTNGSLAYGTTLTGTWRNIGGGTIPNAINWYTTMQRIA